MSPLLQRWHHVQSVLQGHPVRLLAVSKYTDDASVATLIEAGQVDFAESRPQSLRDRANKFPDVCWHMIGSLQRNKAKYVARHASMWHSVEDIETARVVANHLIDRRLPVLLQVNMGSPQQHGVLPDALPSLYAGVMALPALEIHGLMCMAPKDRDARACFSRLRSLRDSLTDGSLHPIFDERPLELCMGMSHDYSVAIKEGATMVRLGTALFGQRSAE